MVYKRYLSKVPEGFKISEHFTLKEFRSPDVDWVYYDTNVLKKLEQIRAHFGGTIHINSGYRTAAYNASVGGGRTSAHCLGRAVDFVVKDSKGIIVPPKQVCLYLERTGWAWGIGMMRSATHMDNRSAGLKMDETRKDATSSTGYYTLSQHGQTFAMYFGLACPTGFPSAPVGIGLGTEANTLKWQGFLCWAGFTTAKDGHFGPDSKAKTEAFQKKYGLPITGIADLKTIAKAKTVTK